MCQDLDELYICEKGEALTPLNDAAAVGTLDTKPSLSSNCFEYPQELPFACFLPFCVLDPFSADLHGEPNCSFLLKKAKMLQTSFFPDSDTECMQHSKMTRN